MPKGTRLFVAAAICAVIAAGCGSNAQSEEEFMVSWHRTVEGTHQILASAMGQFLSIVDESDEKGDEETEERIESLSRELARDLQEMQVAFEGLRPPKKSSELHRLQELSASIVDALAMIARDRAGERLEFDFDEFTGKFDTVFGSDQEDRKTALEEIREILKEIGESSAIVDTYALLSQVTSFDDMPPGYDMAMPLQTDVDRFWDFSDPAGTEIKFREALDHAPEDAEDYRAELIAQIARTFGLRGKFEEAHELLDQVAEMLPRTNDYVETRYLLERGRAFNSAGEKEKAKALFLQAIDAGKLAKDDYLVVDAMHMLAIVEEAEQALEWNLRAFQLLEETRQEKAKSWIGALSNNIAWTYHDMGEYATALSYFEKGRDYRAAEVKEPGYRIAKWAVARCKRSLGLIEEALAEQMAIASEYYEGFDGQGGTIDIDGYIAEEIAEGLLALGRNDEAKPYFKAAHRELSKDDWLADNEPDRLARLKNLGS